MSNHKQELELTWAGKNLILYTVHRELNEFKPKELTCE
jgi:hypothetical protein